MKTNPRRPNESKWLRAKPAERLESSCLWLRTVELGFALLNAGAQHWRNMTRTSRCCSRGCRSGRETSGRMVPTSDGYARTSARARSIAWRIPPCLGRSTWACR
jgi:hypothetical protein